MGLLPAARQSSILRLARLRGTVRITELAAELGVSEMTVRRDMENLVNVGYLDRVHGGAIFRGDSSSDEPGFERKLERQEPEKIAIATEAVKLVAPSMVIGLSAGTTTWRLARLMARVRDITVVTNSVQVATVFHREADPSVHTILIGGQRTPSDALVGPLATSSLHQLHLDLLFLGVHGMDVDAGFTTPNVLEAETNRVFISRSKRVVVLADHTKWGKVGMCTIAALDQVSCVVSDEGLTHQAVEALRERRTEVVLASLRGGDQGVHSCEPGL